MNQPKQKPAPQPENQNDDTNEVKPKYCGIIMPIAAMLPEYDAGHWLRVKEIISDAITQAGFHPRLVSEADDVGVIHGHIVQNLYDDEIVVCDVSGKNPNVMFELGMRLAFDKPTIIVQDDTNGYSFDIGPIKHIGYRKDQRYDDVQEFKEKVAIAITATLAKKQAEENFSPFLKHFGSFTPKQVEGHEIPAADFIMRKLNNIEQRLEPVLSIYKMLPSYKPSFLQSLSRLSDNATHSKGKLTSDIVSAIRSAVDALPKEASEVDMLRAKKMAADECLKFARHYDMSGKEMMEQFEIVWDAVVNGVN